MPGKQQPNNIKSSSHTLDMKPSVNSLGPNFRHLTNMIVHLVVILVLKIVDIRVGWLCITILGPLNLRSILLNAS